MSQRSASTVIPQGITLRGSLKYLLFLILAVSLVALFFAFQQVREEKNTLRSEMQKQAGLLAENLAQSVGPLLETGSQQRLKQLIDRFDTREKLAGVAVYDQKGNVLTTTQGLARFVPTTLGLVTQALARNTGREAFISEGRKRVHLYIQPLRQGTTVIGAVGIFHDASHIDDQSARLWRRSFTHVFEQTFLVVLIALLIIRWSISGSIVKTAQWMRDVRTGQIRKIVLAPKDELLQPLTEEVTQFVKSLESARAAAEEEARLRESSQSLWTAELLRAHVRNRLGESPLFVVSNREPYMHTHNGKSVETVVPASGLVTALEPILRASNGTWIAHGGGDADREMADKHGRLRVPPDDPQYTLRRTWLTEEEEEGYYLGFCNEGLWPLCHVAHTRPIFRSTDWEYYQTVNKKFAQSVIEEIQGYQRPAILLQDYHFALLASFIKQQRPDARVAIFWHIPWPNPEVFGICPWQRQLVDGLLGADLIGFHTQSHCNNFLGTVEHAVEARVDRGRFGVYRKGHFTRVRPFPISVAIPEVKTVERPYTDRIDLLKELGISTPYIGIGVDRLDYTKGIPERFRGVERFLEKHPRYQGQFTFIQIGAPSRTHIQRYRDLMVDVEEEANRINKRFRTQAWQPIVLLSRHHSHQEIDQYYRAADLCLVTSLHDGMNLVAKEFVAARDDGYGTLILSQFAGATHELRDALVVNPYDTDQLAEALRYALEMDPKERQGRMRRMRQVVRENNIYRWAANLITALSEIRVESSQKPQLLPPRAQGA